MALATSRIIVVDSVTGIQDMLETLANKTVPQPNLFFDLEGTELGRHSTLDICTIYCKSSRTTYLVDVQTLGAQAFSTSESTGYSLKTLFEDPSIQKCVFDIRNDSDALYSLFQVRIDGVRDIQLMELATRTGIVWNKKYLAGLRKCVQQEATPGSDVKTWLDSKDKISARLNSASQGTRSQIFGARPLSQGIQAYCAQDVIVLPWLFDIYNGRLAPGQSFWRNEVDKAVSDRIKLSQGARYNGRDPSKALGPWDAEYIDGAREQWNDDILFSHFNAEPFDDDQLGLDDDDYEFDGDLDDMSARDCTGWEEDMIRHGSPF